MEKQSGFKQRGTASAKAIIDAYFDGSLPDDVNDRIFEWIINYGHSESIDEALMDVYLDRIEPNPIPDAETIRNYNTISTQLGFPREDLIKEEVFIPRQDIRPRRSLLSLSMKIAAVALPFIVLLSVYMSGRFAGDDTPVCEPFIAVAAETDAPRRVELPEGSVVWLNGGSSIECKGDVENGIEVSLDGDAFFSVTPDRLAPFRVVTSNVTVEVLGTEFRVSDHASDQDACVVLVKGSVKVSASGGKEFTLEPEQSFVLNKEDSQVNIVALADVVLPDWKVVDLDFDDRSLGEILRAAATYYNRTIRFDDGIHTDEHFTLNFPEDGTIEGILEVLKELSGDFDYRTDGDTIIIYPL